MALDVEEKHERCAKLLRDFMRCDVQVTEGVVYARGVDDTTEMRFGGNLLLEHSLHAGLKCDEDQMKTLGTVPNQPIALWEAPSPLHLQFATAYKTRNLCKSRLDSLHVATTFLVLSAPCPLNVATGRFLQFFRLEVPKVDGAEPWGNH
jgi:hypothetical protein